MGRGMLLERQPIVNTGRKWPKENAHAQESPSLRPDRDARRHRCRVSRTGDEPDVASAADVRRIADNLEAIADSLRELMADQNALLMMRRVELAEQRVAPLSRAQAPAPVLTITSLAPDATERAARSSRCVSNA